MAVKLRMKQLGRRHRPFYRICAIDGRAPRDGKVIEELGHYDPLVRETDARAILKAERIDYWLGVGAQPTEKVRVLIKKYGTNGTHLDAQRAALERLAIKPQAPPPVRIELKVPQPAQTEAASAGEGSEGEQASAAESESGS